MSATVRRVNLVLGGLCAAYFAVETAGVAGGRRQWDFTMRYAAARAYESGLDPYVRSNLESVMGRTITLPYVYPPLLLKATAFMSRIEERAAYLAHLALKLAALAWVVLMWRRVAPSHTEDIGLLAMYVAAGFQETVLRDVRAGNVSLFEQALLWTGVLVLLRRKSGGFGLAVGAAASAKQLPLAWLSLSATRGAGQAARAAAAGLVVWGSVIAVSWITEPVMFREFLANASTGLVERGRINPSSLALLLDGADLLSAPHAPAYALWGFWALAVATLCFRLWRSGRLSEDPLVGVSLLLAAYSITAPRMKDYSYIVMLLPALVLIRHSFRRPLARGAMHALVLAGFLSYNSLLTALVLWGASARQLMGRGAPAARVRPRPQ
jgi:hypothetical protein